MISDELFDYVYREINKVNKGGSAVVFVWGRSEDVYGVREKFKAKGLELHVDKVSHGITTGEFRLTFYGELPTTTLPIQACDVTDPVPQEVPERLIADINSTIKADWDGTGCSYYLCREDEKYFNAVIDAYNHSGWKVVSWKPTGELMRLRFHKQ